MFNQSMFVRNNEDGTYFLNCTGCQTRKSFTREEFNKLPDTHTSLCVDCDKKMKKADKLAEVIWKDLLIHPKKFTKGFKMQRNGVFGLRGRIYKHLLGEKVFSNDEIKIIKTYLDQDNICT